MRAAVLAVLMTVLIHTTAMSASAERPRQSQTDRYADGVYTATGRYGGQPSSIGVTVTVKDGIVSGVVVEPHAYVARSLELQKAFAAAVPKVVVGKRLDEVRVGKLAGSSGTPQGFNDAIDQIKRQAAR
ncbi:hypothetical protein [Rhizobium sp. CF142]|uniref:hypothetical protein n=1 Tax=Rhizobium sp. CF142 TaxID=1144314 RepID=UPI00026EF43F|nr:hypothetical protein [Rhizobium sp. CF142]EJJ29485.1 hypothetical protein PMI11_02224 [Rhizobium sp. CF142]